MYIYSQKICFVTAENEPSKIWQICSCKNYLNYPYKYKLCRAQIEAANGSQRRRPARVGRPRRAPVVRNERRLQRDRRGGGDADAGVHAPREAGDGLAEACSWRRAT